MLLDECEDSGVSISSEIKINDSEYRQWNAIINKIVIPKNVLQCISIIRKALGSVVIATTDERHNVYVSDRRWKKIVRLLRASAFAHDREYVSLADLMPIYNCLWQEPEEIEGIKAIVIRALFSEFSNDLVILRRNLENDIRVSRQHRATDRAKKNMELYDSNKKIYDNYYYHLLDHDTGNTYVFITDYQNMRRASRENAGQGGIIYKDPNNPQRSIVRCYDGNDVPSNSSSVYLTRDEECIYINGVRFYIETLQKGEKQLLPSKHGNVSGRDYFQEIEDMSSQITERAESICNNIFVSETDKKAMKAYVQTLFTEIAHTRQDMEKLED